MRYVAGERRRAPKGLPPLPPPPELLPSASRSLFALAFLALTASALLLLDGTGGMPAVARQLEEAVNKAKDVSKLDEVQVQVEARMSELQQKLAALEEGGAAAAAPAPPPQQQQQQYVALEAPAAEVAGAPAEGGDHETSVSDDA